MKCKGIGGTFLSFLFFTLILGGGVLTAQVSPEESVPETPEVQEEVAEESPAQAPSSPADSTQQKASEPEPAPEPEKPQIDPMFIL